MLKPGRPAPLFTAILDDGSPFDLAALRGQNVVLYFYPKDFTAGCTAQACSFRDNYAAITAAGAALFGVSGDGEESHTRFRERHNLPFPLIADPGREVHRRYEVTGLLPFITPRITYVIDAEGVIRAAIRHDLLVTQHIPDVLAALKQLGPAPEAS
ncbi:MAG: peroxiredoxin [Dehalococcoidia bacterium]|nr:peroxiredoxin [Dehalococcoidia bacterium]